MLDEHKKSIEALVDDALTPQMKQSVLETIRHNPELRDYYISLIKQKYVLSQWWIQEKEKSH